MFKANIIRIRAVFLKDLKTEFRTRYGISAISLFILTSITMLVLSTGQEKMTEALYSGLLWVIMFFSSMTGLSKGFVGEEERKTSLLLKIASKSGAIYFGKLLYNILFSLSLNLLAVMLFLLFFDNIAIESPFPFFIIIMLGSFGIGSATTIISAIISKAGIKNSLFTALSFPVLLPLIIVGIEGTTMSFEGVEINELTSIFQILLAYSGVLIPVSYILFAMIWEE